MFDQFEHIVYINVMHKGDRICTMLRLCKGGKINGRDCY